MTQKHSEPSPIAVCHVITGLNTGGAETSLYRLLKVLDPKQFAMQVISLSDSGTIGSKIARLGVTITNLGMRAGVVPLSGLLKLRALLKLRRPNVIQSWMYHANLMALLAARSLPKSVPLVWNVRHCLYDLKDESLNTRWVIRATRMLSGLVAGIIYNSELSQEQHEAFGYESVNASRIPNGFDLQTLRFDSLSRRRVRAELSIPSDALVVGHVGRYHPMKDHATFLNAAAVVTRANAHLHIVMCGEGIDRQNCELTQLVRQFPQSRLHLLGERKDVPEVMSALDIFCCSSSSEAFPNVLGEAMATELPCVTTDAGDSASIVGGTGVIVRSRDPGALASALETMLNLSTGDRARLGRQARRRIEQHYSVASVSESYQHLYRSMAARNR